MPEMARLHPPISPPAAKDKTRIASLQEALIFQNQYLRSRMAAKELIVFYICALMMLSVQIASANTLQSGTGFMITTDGFLVTNYHVIDPKGAHYIKDHKGKTYEAKLVGADLANDIAILKADGNFSALPILNSSTAKRGQFVITIGFPHVDLQGVEAKVTDGIINSLSGIRRDPRHFQISVPVQSGNSGGPLITNEGSVIGIVVSKLRALEVYKDTGDLPQNVNYAIKANYLSELVSTIPAIEQMPRPPNRKPYSWPAQ